MSKDPFSHLIIGKAMQTHSALGPGLVEEFYHQDLVGRLRASGIEHLSKPRFDLLYRGFHADTFEPDIVFPGKLIPELKALRGEFVPSHYTQLLAYLKAWQISVGLLIDFGKASLDPIRVRFDPVEALFPKVKVPTGIPHADLARHVVGVLQQMHAEMGLGYRETTWHGVFAAAMRAEGMNFDPTPETNVLRHGVARLRCILVESACPVMITALGTGVSAADRAVMQSSLRWLQLPWGIAAHFGRHCVDVRIILAPRSNQPQ